MRRVKSTKNYHIFQKADGRYSVKDLFGSFVYGIEKESVLRKNGLIILAGEKSDLPVNKPLNQEVSQEIQSDILNRHIDHLELTEREHNCLNQEGIRYVKTLVQKTEMEILNSPSLRKISLANLVKALEIHGLTLGMQIDAESIRNRPPITAENLLITDINLSVRELNCLQSEEVIDLKELVQKTEHDLLRIPNFGKESLSGLQETLGSFGLSLAMGSSDVIWVEKESVTAVNLLLTDINLSERESNCLESEGINNLQELVQKTERDLLRIPGFGKRSMRGLQETLGSFGLSLAMGSSDVIWVSPEKNIEAKVLIEYIPENFDIAKNFGDSIGEFIAQYVMTIPNKSHQLIFERRITARTKNIPSLEEVGVELGITRERVRQLEKKIIRQLVRVIFRGLVLKGNRRIDYDFAKMWDKVATNFQDLTEISVTDFINEILTSWDICFDDIEEYFNFVSVIFTGKVKSHLVSQLRTSGSAIVSLREKFGTEKH